MPDSGHELGAGLGIAPITGAALLALLPHRSPFLLLDQITDLIPGQFAIGQVCLGTGHAAFGGASPVYGQVPPMLLVEAMAQTAMVVAASTASPGQARVFLRAIPKARFRARAVLDQPIRIRCEAEGCRPHGGREQVWRSRLLAEQTSRVVAEVRLVALVYRGTPGMPPA